MLHTGNDFNLFSGWADNLAHLQQVVGLEKDGVGITGWYMHTFLLCSVCHVIDDLGWSNREILVRLVDKFEKIMLLPLVLKI